MSVVTTATASRRRGWAALLKSFLLEARPIVLVLFVMRFMVGALESTGAMSVSRLSLGALAWTFVTAGIYLTNASSDVEADVINRKNRPLANGQLTTREVNAAALVSFGVSVTCAASLGAGSLAIVSLMAILGTYYSVGWPRPGKAHYATAAATITVGIFLPYVAGSLANSGSISSPSLWTGIVFAIWAAIAGMSKDFADVEGDRSTGRRTLPVSLGLRSSAFATGGLAGVFAILLLAIGNRVVPTDGTVVLVAGVCAFAAACAVIGARGRQTQAVGLPYRIFVLTQITANTAIAVVAIGSY
ncbi:UbiA family prenyltransferase [Sinomonas albida]|uniref:UbiA family prenyltransferase n=1 Tax=Sinomonas albida TaxID=369942 RepID=UPI00301A5D6C